MKQKQINTIKSATDAAQMILGGIAELGATINLPYNPQADINAELVNTIMACGNHEQGKQVKATRRNALVDAINEAQKFARVVRDVIKLVLGNEYTDLWTALGFQDSLAVSDLPEDLKRMLQAMVSHLTNNPTLEVGAMITAVRAQALHDAIVAAQVALLSQEATVTALMAVRDDKYEVLRKRVSSVYQELRMQLGPLDPRWGNFGFYKPGADETPDQVEGVVVTLLGATAAAVKWGAAARAQYYRVWFKVHGSVGDYVTVGSPADLDLTIENLPQNTMIDIVVTAVNNGGESKVSQVVSITMHP